MAAAANIPLLQANRLRPTISFSSSSHPIRQKGKIITLKKEGITRFFFFLFWGFLLLFFLVVVEGIITCASSNGREPDSVDSEVKKVEQILAEKRRAQLSTRIASGEFTVKQSGYLQFFSFFPGKVSFLLIIKKFSCVILTNIFFFLFLLWVCFNFWVYKFIISGKMRRFTEFLSVILAAFGK